MPPIKTLDEPTFTIWPGWGTQLPPDKIVCGVRGAPTTAASGPPMNTLDCKVDAIVVTGVHGWFVTTESPTLAAAGILVSCK